MENNAMRNTQLHAIRNLWNANHINGINIHIQKKTCLAAKSNPTIDIPVKAVTLSRFLDNDLGKF